MIIILTLISGLSIGQNQASTDFDIDYLNGTWKNISKFGGNQLTYTKSVEIEKDYVGSVIEFKADGKVISRNIVKSRRCGNDLRRIPRKGKWNFDKETGILKTTMQNPISGNQTTVSYKISELTNNELIMESI